MDGLIPSSNGPPRFRQAGSGSFSALVSRESRATDRSASSTASSSASEPSRSASTSIRVASAKAASEDWTGSYAARSTSSDPAERSRSTPVPTTAPANSLGQSGDEVAAERSGAGRRLRLVLGQVGELDLDGGPAVLGRAQPAAEQGALGEPAHRAVDLDDAAGTGRAGGHRASGPRRQRRGGGVRGGVAGLRDVAAERHPHVALVDDHRGPSPQWLRQRLLNSSGCWSMTSGW